MFISDQQWEVLRPILEVPKTTRLGRPRADARAVFEAILFILHTGIQWKYLPGTFPPKSTVHDYLSRWSRSEAFRKLFARVIRQLVQHRRIDLDECFIDATFAAAKSGGIEVGLTRKGKGSKLQVVVDAQGVPLSVSTASAGAGEPAMVQQTLAFMEPAVQPERLVGDKGYDCDALDEALNHLGIEMIAPHRRNRRPETATQDGRPLRRYKRRWIVERTLAWLGQHRRLLTRWEKHAANYASFAVLGCLMIALRHLPS
jgi:transposase